MTGYDKSDFWAVKARNEGYPARSVYKLQELVEKFSLLPPDLAGFRALDLGAAPGSWSLFLLREYRRRFRARGGSPPPFLAAADLSPLSSGGGNAPAHGREFFSGENFFFLEGDFTRPENRETLRARGPYHLIVSDAAPATTGSRTVDTLRSLSLAEEALLYAETALVSGGHFLVKVFQGGDTAALLKKIRSLFRAGKTFKPRASRPESFETYYVGLEKKGP
ncbi:MAG: RlmE family RNA methyltransferase [Spirochaetaceae bacterium]|nr:RlmE family RNA methyltransferase [Spirochaetaceae bacterium]